MFHRADWRTTGDSLRKRLGRWGEDPSIFAIVLETLAVKAFGDMGQMARLRLIRDRFIAGHSSCELRRYLDSVPPETPIRDVVDRCRVWVSHADPEIRRVSKPGPEPVYPACIVSDSDKGVHDLRVAVVATSQYMPDQVEILFRRLLASAAAPTPVPASSDGKIVTASGGGD